jgi:phosphoribosylaminoimidazolecarboxamide formyltransferase/IMP cyclohydrolase
MRPRRALVSVHDKQGVVRLCRALVDLGVRILSSGGTASLLESEGVPVTAVSDYTGFPEMLDGRVKTLHPRIHAGILAVRDDERHMADLKSADIEPIDLVVVNLYPFARTAATGGIAPREAIEMIDIGGPTLVRGAAKNFEHVAAVVDPGDYEAVVAELRCSGGLGLETRRRMAAKAFRHTASYDDAVQAWLARLDAGAPPGEAAAFPDRLDLGLVKHQELRYGENPHQRAAFYREPLAPASSVAAARQLQGTTLSFNNILDFDAALGLVAEFADCAAAIIKHGNPCGAALGDEPARAFRRALACDPTSAFGGVIAFNRKVDGRTAQAIAEQFYEGVVAPGFDSEALRELASKKKLRLLEVDEVRPARAGWDLRRVHGGLLVQDWDTIDEDVRSARVVTARAPSDDEWAALSFAWKVARHVKSNAIVYAAGEQTVGIGAGQMSRVDAARFGIAKAATSLDGAVLASDAFFPFRDGVDVAAAAGVRAIVQPGGSIRDDEVIAAANEHGMAMVLTGRRHFRH